LPRGVRRAAVAIVMRVGLDGDLSGRLATRGLRVDRTRLVDAHQNSLREHAAHECTLGDENAVGNGFRRRAGSCGSRVRAV